MDEELKRKIESMHFGSIEELNKFLEEYMRKKNDTPIDELGGLTPDDMYNLLYLRFDSGISPIVINKDLNEEELSCSTFYNNAKKVLRLIADGAIKATAKGNLNREFVMKAAEQINYDLACIMEYRKALNENEVLPVHIIRIILTASDLIIKRYGYFTATKKGITINTGELYYLLFRTFFYKFNLSYLDRLPEFPEIQQLINFTFYMGRTNCNKWTSTEDFYNKVIIRGLMLDKKYEEILKEGYRKDLMFWAFEHRIIEPMINFGLFEKRETTDEKKKKFNKRYSIRKSPLFEKFMNFDFDKKLKEENGNETLNNSSFSLN